MEHLPVRSPIALALIAGLALALAPVQAQQPGQPDTRIVVKTADDLPRHTYQIQGKASEFLVSDKAFKDFLNQIKADTEADLAKYKIEDPTTLQGYYGLLQQVAMLQGRFDDAQTYIEKVRALESKESKKLMTGQVLNSMIAARKAAGADSAKFTPAFKQELALRVKSLPWDKVRDEVTQAKGRAELVTKDLILGQLQGQLDPVVEQAGGQLSGDLARGLVGARAAMDIILPLNPSIVEVYSSIIDSNKVAKKDIWTERLVTLTPADKGTPVVVSVWDSGVDTAIFSNQLWSNPKEIANGKDDDANGFVDDVNGIAFDLESNRTPALLHPISELRSDKALVTSHTKGLMDLQANVDSPEASNLKKYVGSLKPDQVTPFLEDLNLFGGYAHGTHVAGITSEGNPYIRLLPVRITFDFRTIPTVTPSVEQAQKEAKAATDAVAYMKAAGVRVVNMSWGGSRKDIEDALEKKGVGANAEERAELSRKLFKIQRDALEAAMKSAPEILFVAAAGNSDNDNEFAEFIPSGLNLPNMITIGAVDESGKPTGFTTFGKNVKLYANGFEVDSYIPGGQRMKFSGTSMAAPNTANLAAKILAVNPQLSTSEVIELITQGADPMEGYQGRYVINPRKTVDMSRAMTQKK
jgi:subtilisin family serine protease